MKAPASPRKLPGLLPLHDTKALALALFIPVVLLVPVALLTSDRSRRTLTSMLTTLPLLPQ